MKLSVILLSIFLAATSIGCYTSVNPGHIDSPVDTSSYLQPRIARTSPIQIWSPNDTFLGLRLGYYDYVPYYRQVIPARRIILLPVHTPRIRAIVRSADKCRFKDWQIKRGQRWKEKAKDSVTTADKDKRDIKNAIQRRRR